MQIAPALVLYAGNAGYVDSIAFDPDKLLSSDPLSFEAWKDLVHRVRLMIEAHRESLQVLNSGQE